MPPRSRLIPIAATLLLAALAFGCSGPPQIGPDREAFKMIDALFTAVSLREAGRVDECMRKLAELKAAGKLPGSAYNALDSIAAEGKGGRWEAASDRLRDFMLGQHK